MWWLQLLFIDKYTSKICTPIPYEVNYRTNGTSNDTHCSDANYAFPFYWTRYNPNEKLMIIIVTLVFLSSGIPVLGFDWDSICNITVPDKTLNIDLHTNTCVANDDISQALGTITTMVSRNPYQRPAAKQLLMLSYGAYPCSTELVGHQVWGNLYTTS